MPAPYTIRSVAVDPVTWTPIAPAGDCNTMVLLVTGASDVKMRTPGGSAQKTVSPGIQQIIQGPLPPLPATLTGQLPRFRAGIPVVEIQSVAGTGPIFVDEVL